tara:strand:+ start:1038 stop:1226 length:189 start_codon:yes stop_codon:yes gene_type:complete
MTDICEDCGKGLLREYDFYEETDCDGKQVYYTSYICNNEDCEEHFYCEERDGFQKFKEGKPF